jgi:hypothetical protein
MRFDATFLLFGLSLLSVALLHALAMHAFLYWLYPWFDIPMHFLGGAVAGFGFLSWVGERLVPLQRPTLARTLSFVLAVGIAWEIFELTFGVTGAVSWALDTSADIVLDLLGGATAFMIARAFDRVGM